jgi:phosphohistidine phosphatase SixA
MGFPQIRGRAILAVSLLLSVVAALSPPSPAAQTLRGKELARALREGGYVVYLRHAATDPNQADTDRATLERCETQRNLSAEGRQMARDIGRAFKAQGIRVGKVLSSPCCRTTETARLAFGDRERSSALYFAVGADRDQRARLTAQLRQMLGTPPAPGTNTVIVSHHANLKEAAGIWPKNEGDAHVFRPGTGGAFDHVGEIGSEEWPPLARDASPNRTRMMARDAGVGPAR